MCLSCVQWIQFTQSEVMTSLCMCLGFNVQGNCVEISGIMVLAVILLKVEYEYTCESMKLLMLTMLVNGHPMNPSMNCLEQLCNN